MLSIIYSHDLPPVQPTARRAARPERKHMRERTRRAIVMLAGLSPRILAQSSVRSRAGSQKNASTIITLLGFYETYDLFSTKGLPQITTPYLLLRSWNGTVKRPGTFILKWPRPWQPATGSYSYESSHYSPFNGCLVPNEMLHYAEPHPACSTT